MTQVLDCSFLTFVYPFAFDPARFEDLAGQVEKTVIPNKTQLFWEPDKFPHSELLPHIASYFNPDDTQTATARLWKISDVALTGNDGLGARKGVWRFIYRRKDEDAPDAKAQEFEVAFNFAGIQLFLFRAGVGLLALRVQPQTNSLTSWQDFLHFFRYFKRDAATLAARRKTGKDTYQDFFPAFATGGETRADGRGNIQEIVRALLHTAGADEWWRDVFIHKQMLPYAALFVEGYPPADDYLLAYRLRNLFHTGQGQHPAPTDLLPQHPALLEYSARQWFIFALDGGSFLACDPPDTQFFRKTLPEHLGNQYFHLYAIALHQRFALMCLSHEVAENWQSADEAARMTAFERIRDRFLTFTARGYFAQVMQREHHHRCYRQWQQTFELQRMYDEVREEVREMYEWLQLRRAAKLQQLAEDAKEQAERLGRETKAREQAAQEQADRLERRLSRAGLLVALGFGLPSLVIAFLGINLRGWTSSEGVSLRTALLLGGGCFVVGLLLALGFYARFNHPPDPSDDSGDTA